MFRSLGRFHIACPGDALEVISCMDALRQTEAPAYLRLGKKNEPIVHTTPPICKIGKALQMRDGLDVALLSTGNILPEAVGACRLLENRDIDVGHWHFPWVVPVDGTVLEEVLSRYSLVVTVEEHSIEGGFGSLAAEWFAERPHRNARLLRIGLPTGFICQTTNTTHARRAYQLDAEGICAKIETALKV
jgi:transketolase